MHKQTNNKQRNQPNKKITCTTSNTRCCFGLITKKQTNRKPSSINVPLKQNRFIRSFNSFIHSFSHSWSIRFHYPHPQSLLADEEVEVVVVLADDVDLDQCADNAARNLEHPSAFVKSNKLMDDRGAPRSSNTRHDMT